MTRNLKHPLRLYFSNVGAGRKPSPQEIDELAREVLDGIEGAPIGFAELRREIREATDKIIASHAEGHMGDARSHSREAAEALVDRVGEEHIPPPTAEDKEMDPEKLAGMVPR